ncbi:cobaltochelatase subunit CobN [Vibrio methylphosphonaticus]|uniref:cobaltochelatase subunit CobN n=1 Tax=Vibrio methylphosphonaticus TaxID=2946866 RepID=UPI00202A0CCD|nr:cobaltochelatase subunit CobN [Vibrio methylphosphonaticus]MCL9774926.1 cobaltochelatase subunit CobN [Vibrio methylphosphonaticus]
MITRYVLARLLIAACFFAATGSSMAANIVLLHTDFVSNSKIKLLSEIARDNQVELIVTKRLSSEILTNAELVIADAPRTPDKLRLQPLVNELPNDLPWMILGNQSQSASEFLSAELVEKTADYWHNGTKENYVHLFKMIRAWQNKESIVSFPAAQKVPLNGIYYDHEYVTDLSKRLGSETDTNKPIVGLVISRSVFTDQEFNYLERMTRLANESNVIPVFYWFDGRSQGLDWPWHDIKPTALVNLTHLHNGKDRIEEISKLDVPVIQTLHYRTGDAKSWQQSEVGVDAGIASVMLSTTEAWGFTDPLVISAGNDGKKQVIEPQVALLFDKITAMYRLQTKLNQDKSIAVMYWNAPAGAENISASNLNVPRSIQSISSALNTKGYKVDTLNEQQSIEDAKQLLSGYYQPDTTLELLNRGYAASVSLDDYLEWFKHLPIFQQKFLLRWWGDPAQHTALREVDGKQAFVFPVKRYGNLVVLPQPPRAGTVGHAIHNTKEPPDHLYLAVYLWLQQQHESQKLDALIHLGTHGSQEWTPGKARGLSASDFPYITLGAVPVIYPYIQDNIAEALQAKRRGRATIISHQTPPFGPAGLYGDYVALNGLLGDYQTAPEGAVKDKLQQQITEQILALDIAADMGMTNDVIHSHFDEAAGALESHFERLAADVIPLGLHSFGIEKSHQEVIYTILLQLGDEFIENFEPSASAFWQQFDGDLSTLDSTVPAQWIEGIIQGDLEPSDEMNGYADMVKLRYPKLANNDELNGLLNALDGRYVSPGAGGDPIRNPNSTSGTNLYGFDPAKIPSAAAYAASEKELKKLIAAHEDENGERPEKIAFSLWAGETQRHFGMLEAQVLRALGLEPIWDRGGNLKQLKVIPAEALERERIDVVIQATSVYRDQFDGFMRKLSTAIEEIAQLEDNNAIALNSRSVADELIAKGYSKLDAQRFASVRIFSNAPGDYGSGVNHKAIQSQTWDHEDALGKQFVSRLQYAYGGGMWGEKQSDINLFAYQLADVDAAIMTRSSRLHGVLSTDHPFEYLGGLSSAIRTESGEAPSLYISDLRQAEGRTVTASQFLGEELNARYMNPTWLKAMKTEGYSGAINMLDVTNNIFGWQVTAPETVRDEQWERLSEVLIDDKYQLDLNEWFERHQPAAQMQIIERMMEAVRKGYWQASEERLRSLIARHQELAPMVEHHQAHEITQRYLNELAAGFGMSGSASSSEQSETVSGNIMKEVDNVELPNAEDTKLLLLILFSLVCVAFGALSQYKQMRD